MKNSIVLLFGLIITQATFAAKTKEPVLRCIQKFESLSITKNDEYEDYYDLNRTVRTNFTRGYHSASGIVETQSKGHLSAKLVNKTKSSLTFKLENGNSLQFDLVTLNKDDGTIRIQITTNEPGLEDDLNEILKTSENTLEFYNPENCVIK